MSNLRLCDYKESNKIKTSRREVIFQLDNLDKLSIYRESDFKKPQLEDTLVRSGIYQINNTNGVSTLKPGFCGSQCFVVVLSTEGTQGENGFITQMAISYNDPNGNGGIAIRRRTGISAGMVWSSWKYL